MSFSREAGQINSIYPRIAYVRRHVDNVKSAACFVQNHIGGSLRADDPEEAVFGIGEHIHVLSLNRSHVDSIGIDLGDEATLELTLSRLTKAGYRVEQLTKNECRLRYIHTGARTTDPSGNILELIARAHVKAVPELQSRNLFMTGLRGVALASTDIAADTVFWTNMIGGRVSDWAGEITYIKFDSYHHRISLYPSEKKKLLYPVFELAQLDDLFRRYYAFLKHQVPILFGVGRAGPSKEYFLKTRCPEGLTYALGFGIAHLNGTDVIPKQYEKTALSLCTLGSEHSAFETDGLSVGAIYTAQEPT